MIWKLLRKNISAGQIAGYAIANFVGLAIVLGAVKFYGDISTTWQSDDSFIRKDYLIISKSVTALKTMGVGKGENDFSADDVAQLEAQPWVRKVGPFTSANFNIMGSLSLGGRGMSTYLFFEAIPNEFMDIEPAQWTFDPRRPEIPIIMSKDYLTLYNFGFAATRGMPQLSETMMQRVPIEMTLSGNGHHETFRARIVGFSSRLNTIAVPEEFMKWANARYAPQEVVNPSRLVVEVNDPGNPAIERYFTRMGYEVAGDKADNSKASYFLTIVTTIVLAVGAIISVLAFFILTLSIFLLLQKNRNKLHDLMLLGYTSAQVARPYCLLVVCVNCAVLVLSTAAALGASLWWAPRLGELGIPQGSPVVAIITGVCIVAAITLANCLVIRRLVARNFYD